MDPLQHLLDMATTQDILSPLPLVMTMWRTSLYADNVAIFINPIKDDLDSIMTIL
jgi:hypothetical protein